MDLDFWLLALFGGPAAVVVVSGWVLGRRGEQPTPPHVLGAIAPIALDFVRGEITWEEGFARASKWPEGGAREGALWMRMNPTELRELGVRYSALLQTPEHKEFMVDVRERVGIAPAGSSGDPKDT